MQISQNQLSHSLFTNPIYWSRIKGIKKFAQHNNKCTHIYIYKCAGMHNYMGWKPLNICYRWVLLQLFVQLNPQLKTTLMTDHPSSITFTNLCLILTGFIPKKSFQNSHFLNVAWKGNTKVCNSSTHLVKGHHSYCSWWLTHSVSQNWFLNYCSVSGNAVSDRCVDIFYLALWRPQNSQTPLSFHRLSRPWKAYPIFCKLSKTFKDCT